MEALSCSKFCRVGNVLILAELLFSLPASNGKLERVFSIVGTIKVDKCSLLTNESLDDFLLLNSEMFDPNHSLDLWWSANTRKDSQKARKQYKKHCSTRPATSQATDPEETNSEPEDVLRDWDDLMNSSGRKDSYHHCKRSVDFNQYLELL